jgi:transcription elongation factor GreA
VRGLSVQTGVVAVGQSGVPPLRTVKGVYRGRSTGRAEITGVSAELEKSRKPFGRPDPFPGLISVIGRFTVMSDDVRQRIEEDWRQLEAELRTEIPQELKKAVAMGDLSENAEYEAARNRQDYVRARIANLRKRLADLSMIDTSRLPRDRIAYGSTVVLYDLDSGDELTYKLVMAEDSDITKNKISTVSPIGRGLMGRKEGDEVEITTPAGKRRFEVVKLTTAHES